MSELTRDRHGVVSQIVSRDELLAAVGGLRYAVDHTPFGRLADGDRLQALCDEVETEIAVLLIATPAEPWTSDASARKRRLEQSWARS